ncbi:MAG: undecaprenyldiphospho-muramoylpentapeptide beta-N-acetylglucosaminyltransferase [Candidatus Methylomirabilia bacterium]
MRVVIAGGGTGGHTSTGLAVAEALRARQVEVIWIGSHKGIEASRVPAAGIPYHAIPTGKLRRPWDWRNLRDLLGGVPAGLFHSLRLLRRLRPHLLFATGGFVALPPAAAARALAIPVFVHEQTAVAGLANRLAGRFASKVALTFEEARDAFPPDRVVVTGNPLRPELAGATREEGFARLGLDPGRPLVYVTGGAQGSHRINRSVGEILEGLLEESQIIHQCGANPSTRDHDWLEERAQRLPASLRARYRLVPYVGSDLKDTYAAASLVVSRAGAGTVNECCQLARAAIFIPLPGARGDEQTANARIVERAGGAQLLPESELSPERLLRSIRALLADTEELTAMGQRARRLAIPDAAERLADLILSATESRMHLHGGQSRGEAAVGEAGGPGGRSEAGRPRSAAGADSSSSPPPPGAHGTR